MTKWLKCPCNASGTEATLGYMGVGPPIQGRGGCPLTSTQGCSSRAPPRFIILDLMRILIVTPRGSRALRRTMMIVRRGVTVLLGLLGGIKAGWSTSGTIRGLAATNGSGLGLNLRHPPWMLPIVFGLAMIRTRSVTAIPGQVEARSSGFPTSGAIVPLRARIGGVLRSKTQGLHFLRRPPSIHP